MKVDKIRHQRKKQRSEIDLRSNTTESNETTPVNFISDFQISSFNFCVSGN